jgi:hypothetical protein
MAAHFGGRRIDPEKLEGQAEAAPARVLEFEDSGNLVHADAHGNGGIGIEASHDDSIQKRWTAR